MQSLWPYIKYHRLRFAWGAVMLLLTNATAMALPQLFRFAIDGLKSGTAPHFLRTLALHLVLLATAGAIFRVLSRVHVFYAGRDIEMEMRCRLYAHLTTLEPSFFAKHSTGDLMSRTTNDLTQVRLLLGAGFLNIVGTALAYSIAIPLMIMLSVKLTLLAFVVFGVGLSLMYRLARKLYRQTLASQSCLGQLTTQLHATLTGGHVIRAFCREELFEDRFQSLNNNYYAINVALSRTRSSLSRLVMSLASLGIFAAIILGAVDVIQHTMTLGSLVAFIEYMGLLAWPTYALGWILSVWQRGIASWQRINEILQTHPTIASGPFRPKHLQPRLEIKNLSLSYSFEHTTQSPDLHRFALHNINISVPGGTTLGIVGPIGSGKTTLARACLRLLDIPANSVFLGGIDITQLDLHLLRSTFAYVPQNSLLFSRSLADNVAFGRRSAKTADIERVLDASGFATDLHSMPQGLHTLVGERGITLSGGQNQRVALARALLLHAPILILDDALANVDTVTEHTVLHVLRRQRAQLTTIIIAHRITAVHLADHIIVMDQGRICAAGTHKTLLQEGGLYARMAKKQELAQELGIGDPPP